MSQITPFTHALIQGFQSHRQGAVDKEAQMRRAQAAQKDIAAQEDTLEHQVESTDELHEVNDENTGSKQRREKRKTPHQEPESEEGAGLDLTA